MSEKENIEIEFVQREEISDLIGNPPGWILHSGISIIGLVILCLLTGSYFINYPDKIGCTGILTTTDPPIETYINTNGVIEHIYFTSGDSIRKFSPILYLQNTANKEDVIHFMTCVEKCINFAHPSSYLGYNLPENLVLGELNPSYAILAHKTKEVKHLLRQSSSYLQLSTLENEITDIGTLSESQGREKEIFQKELQLNLMDLERNKELLDDSIISTITYEAANKSYLQAQRQFEGMESGIIQNNIRIEQLRLQQEQLKEQRTEKISSLKFNLDELLQRITEEHTMWFQKYHVLAESNGILELNSEIALGKNLKAGSLIGYVLPNLETTDKYIKAIVPTAGIGKIETGDKCIIRFNAYPHKEYGSLETSVTSITSIPLMNSEDELMYEIRINLPETMVTDYGTEIPYRPNMDAGIQIITESKSIIERIFDQILSIIKNT